LSREIPLPARTEARARSIARSSSVAEHPRNWGRRQVIEDPVHRVELVAQRRAARDLKGRDRLHAVAPAFGQLLARWTATGPTLGLRVTRAIKHRQPPPPEALHDQEHRPVAA
jgi:hypothetical protein